MKRSAPAWFRRLAEVPGIAYHSPIAVDRAVLKGADAVARVRAWDYDAKLGESLQWFDSAREAANKEAWGTSESPCSSWETKPKRGESEARMVLRQVYEALELPGNVRDYYFALTRNLDTLWGERAADPSLLAEVEALCLLTVRLIEAHPDVVRNEYYGRARSGDAEGENAAPQREFWSAPQNLALPRFW